MAQLTFPVTKDGLVVPVLIGLSGQMTAALVAVGRPIAAPIPGRGLLDTGTDVTAVAPSILRQLPIAPATRTSTHTVGGQVPIALFEVSLSIFDPRVPTSSWLTQSDMLVMELPAALPNVDVLVGLDLLLQTNLLLKGPARQFTLDF